MRRLLIIVLLGVLSASATIEAQGFGLQFGYLQSKEKYRIGSSNSYKRYPNHFENGFEAGCFYEYDIPGAKGFGLGIGLNYGFARDHDKGDTKVGSYIVHNDTTRTQQVIDLPVYLSWRIKIAKEAAILVQTGPVMSYCWEDRVHIKATYSNESMSGSNVDQTYNRLVSGKRDQTTAEKIMGLTDADRWPGIETLSTSSHYSYKQYLDADIHPFNIMWNVGLGIQYQRYSLRFNYAWGLRNLFQTRRCANDNNAYRLRDRKDEWSISVAYQFVPKKKK